MGNVIKNGLLECHYNFPDFNRSTEDLTVLERIFTKHLAEFNEEQIKAAFDHHIKTADKFPTIADITGALKTTRCYRMDYGPLGFGALYHESHPYIRLQMRMSTDISGYAVDVSSVDAVQLERDARHAPAIEDLNDDERPLITRGGGSFRRLEFDA